jgi:DNA-binding beta-propeller fold protein YncE
MNLRAERSLLRSCAVCSVLSLVVAQGCRQRSAESLRSGDSLSERLTPRLSTGVTLDPAASTQRVGQLPLAMLASPDGQSLVLLLNGYREQGVQVIDRATGAVTQTVPQRAAFLGLGFSPDGRTLYASGGNQDVVYRYDWASSRATLRDSLVLAAKATRASGARYPGGLTASRDGRFLYVAENLGDSLAVIDLASGRVAQRLATQRYPYGVTESPDGHVYVSAWGGNTVSVFARDDNGWLKEERRLTVARHPSAVLLNRDGSRLYVASGSTDQVAVIDTKSGDVLARLLDPPPSGPNEGATPNALALSDDETRLFVAEADANAVAVFDLSARTSNHPSATGNDRLAGRIPSGWYPTAVLALGDTLVVVNGKGNGSRANPGGPQPIMSREHAGNAGAQYTFALLSGSLMRAPIARVRGPQLIAFSHRVARANGWSDSTRAGPRYPPFQHVIYVVKENRTYDQVLGDLASADGDSALVFFPRANSPNHHALAERFGVFDRFFVNAEVSGDGHNWSMAAYATDYLEKTVQSNYGGRGRTYDYEGTNRGHIPDDDVNEPASGYLWNLAEQKGISFRNYGEFVVPSPHVDRDELPPSYRGNKPFLVAHTNPDYPGFDLTIRDQHRADVWIKELAEFERMGNMPTLEIVRLPNDHTSGAMAGRPTPRAAMADNDLALGRMIEALSRSRFWASTVVFVLEDDAQNGPDHVDAHRSPLLVISPYSRAGTIHRFANTTDVLRTIEEILGLGSLAHFDYFGRPLRDVWSDAPDTRPYAALTPGISLDEINTPNTREARDSRRLNLTIEDVAEEDLFNQILWRTIKGAERPYPGPTRAATLEFKRGE